MLILIALSILLLTFSNGANDNFKGVATLFGSGATSYRKALGWATVTTFAGSALAMVLAHGLVDTFKGKGLLPDSVIQQPAFILAVSLGAAITVLLATRFGLPVSTTHALTGGLVGAGLVATGGQIKWAALAASFVVPLLASPVLAILLTVGVYPLFRAARKAFGITSESCLCVGMSMEPVRANADGTIVLARSGAAVQTGEISQCIERYHGRMLGVDAGTSLNAIHFLSAGAVGFARGLNDTPKIVALLLAAGALSPNLGLALVAMVMAAGGILNAKRVSETLSRKITRMNVGQGLTANLVTSCLVLFASRLGMPVSTTHVSVGALFGIGAVRGTAKAQVILTILVAWVTTLPIGAASAAAIYFLVG